MKLNPLVALILNVLRRIVGTIFLVIALLGFILPILPGWPFIIPAVILLGRRDPMLRLLHLLLRRGLRALRRSRMPLLQQIGLRLATEYIRGRQAIMPSILRAERAMPWSQDAAS